MERELLSHLSYELHISADECVPLLLAPPPSRNLRDPSKSNLTLPFDLSWLRFLARATPFWHAREQADARRFRDDGSAAFGTHLLAPNLFMESSPMDV